MHSLTNPTVTDAGLERLTRWDQLLVQLRAGGAQALVPMARGALARAELGLEGMAQSSRRWRSAVDLLNVRRMESRWRYEAACPPAIDLASREARKYSQNGEDGILEWIFDRVGTTNRSFVEIGAADGEENCTRNLLESGWTGIWVEADPELAARARHVAGEQVVVVDAPAEPATIAATLRAAGAPGEPDLVVIDIDGNDWWVLYALLMAFSPRVLVVEYNGTYAPGRWWVEPYREGRSWDRSFRHGASLEAMARLAGAFGLPLVGCNSTGVNSFYVNGEVLRAGGVEVPRRTENLYRGPWFSPDLWGHPRQRYAGADHAPLRPLNDADLWQISLRAERWPTATARPLCVGQPVVVQATVGNGTDERLTSEGGTPLHLAWRWRPAGEPATHWRNETRVKLWPVEPHQIGPTRLWCRAPSSPGSYHLELSLVQENVRWLDDRGATIALEVDQ